MNNNTRIARLSSSSSINDNSDIDEITTIKKNHRTCHHQQTDLISSTIKKKKNHSFKLGQKVTVPSLCVIGTIRYIGEISLKSGLWIGIELDIIGSGKNDGSIKGIRYFDCPSETGLFILSSKVKPFSSTSSSTSTTSSTYSSMNSITPTNSDRLLPKKKKDPTLTLSKSTRTTLSPRQRCSSHPTTSISKPTTSLTTTNNTITSPLKRKPTTSKSTPKKQSSINNDINNKTKESTLKKSTMVTRKSVVPSTTKSTITHPPKSSKSTTTTTTTPTNNTMKKSTTLSNLTSNNNTTNTTTPTLSKKSKTPIKRKSLINEINQKPIPSTTTTTNINQQKQINKNRMTVTPKKRNSIHHQTNSAGSETPLRKSKSTSTRRVITEDELAKMHALLEESRKEKQKLSEEMDGKEAVWERLVSAKESYALQVQENQLEIHQLQQSLINAQQKINQLESQCTIIKNNNNHHHSLSTTSPTSLDTSSTSSFMNESMTNKLNTVNDIEQHYSKRIEKLDKLVREWQQDAQESHRKLKEAERIHMAQLDQLRKDLSEKDQMTATIERECELVKKSNNQTRMAYESTMDQWKQEHDHSIQLKENEIIRLTNMVEELKSCHYLLPPSPDHEDEEEDDDDDGNGELEEDHRKKKKMYSSRRRLEQQLEMTTSALDDLHQHQQLTLLENEQLRKEISQLHMTTNKMDQQYQLLQKELATEINDKRILMEERDVAIQHQLKLEEELKDSQFTNERLEYQLDQLTEKLNQLQQHEDDLDVTLKNYQLENDELKKNLNTVQQSHDTIEQECSKLMDELLNLEELSCSLSSSSVESATSIKKNSSSSSSSSTQLLKNEMNRLKNQLQKQQQKLNDTETKHHEKIKSLNQEIHQLETTMEQKDFKIMELEELWQLEKRRHQYQQQKFISSTTSTSTTNTSVSFSSITTHSPTFSSNSSSTSSHFNKPLSNHHHQHQYPSSSIYPISPISEKAPSPKFSNFGFLHDEDDNEEEQKEVEDKEKLNLSKNQIKKMELTMDSTHIDTTLYCEICETYGHDVIGCNNLIMMNDLLISNDKEMTIDNTDTMVYCVNCDLFNLHSTDDCPNQDETF